MRLAVYIPGYANPVLVPDVSVKTNHDAIAMMFVCPSVCPSETGVHCDHTVHVSMDLSLWLDSPMFWAP